MSKKRKCKLCDNKMNWALPERVTEENYQHSKYCLLFAKNTCVCDHTMKTKGIENEQYCKYFREKKKEELERENNYRAQEIQKLENMIKEYEERAGLT